MFTIKFCLIAVLLACSALAETPISNCLGNCIACKASAPTACLPLLDTSTATEYGCLPYYTGANCAQTVFSYYNLYQQNGPFYNWSLPSPPPAQTCSLKQKGANGLQVLTSNISSIGPFSSNLNATKSLQFSSTQGIQRLIIKITAAISDSQLSSSNNSANSTTTQTVDAQGNLIIQTITSTANTGTLSQPVPFIEFALTDQLNSNAVIANRGTTYQIKSSVETTCGFVYQYEFVVDAPTSKPLQQLMLNLYQSKGTSVVWNLLGFSVEGGCSGFTVNSGSGKCNTCLSGYYPANSPDKILQACNPCDYRCTTCSSSNRCLMCQAYTTFNPATGLCEYPQNYIYFNSFSTGVGAAVNQSNGQFLNLVSSQGQSINLAKQLTNNQSYFLKFYLLYSKNYADNLNSLTIKVNDQPVSTLTALETLTSTLLSSANGGSTQMYLKQIKVDLMGKPVSNNFSLSVIGSSKVSQQFFVGNLVLVQYQCSINCKQCGFNAQTTTSCTQCQPFFSLAQNCKTCANGFFLRNANTCVKCYSNCKQCNGPSTYSCTECFDKFELSDYSFNQTCIECLGRFYKNSSINCYSQCLSNYSNAQLTANSNCMICLNNQGNFVDSTECKSCWLALGLARGKCTPTFESGYIFYASDLSRGQTGSNLWAGSSALSSYSCTSDYLNLYGIASAQNKTQATPSTLTYNLKGLPTHWGLTFVMNIFKTGNWISTNNSLILTISISSPGLQPTYFNITLNNDYGGDICGDGGNEMIWTLQSSLKDHSANQLNIMVRSPDNGVFIRQLQIYLGSCVDCDKIGLSYAPTLIPMYSDNTTQTGIDTWLSFNHPVSFAAKTNSTLQSSMALFANSFKFKIGQTQILNAVLLQNRLLQNSYLKYFIPLQKSYINTTLTVDTSQGDMIYTQDQSVSRQLISSSQSVLIDRYDNLSADGRKSVAQLSQFFHFFAWFCIIVMIISVMLGVGVVFQQFLLLLQVIYIHIYITSALLPPSVKIPLSNAVRMQHLNYFSNIHSIENGLFDGIFIPCEFIFQQFNIDIYFLRSLYPILFINVLYIVWFIILKIIATFIPIVKNSQSKVARFIRSIPTRPLAYADQVWRYQFLTVIWAAMIQFTNFVKVTDGQIVNLIICILAFVIAIVWPFVVTIFTFRRHYTMNVNHFRYLYHDLYYLKISSVADEPKYYLYVGIKYGRLLAYAIFIGLFVNQSVIGPVILIFVNLAELLIAFFLDIYRKGLYLLTRIIENILLSVVAILFLVVYGFSNKDTFSQQAFQNIGFGICTIFVLLIINAIVRWVFLCYEKGSQWYLGTYDVGEQGDKQNYDNRPVKLAQSQRI